MLNGTRLGNAIVDRLKSEGLLQSGREVHYFDVLVGVAGAEYSIVLDGPDGAWNHTVTVEAPSENRAAIATALALAVSEDDIVGGYFDVGAAGRRVTTTAKSPGSFSYDVVGDLQHSAGEPIEDDEDVRELWRFIAEEFVAEITNHAEVTTEVTGTAATEGANIDLEPTDGVPDGEVLADSSVTGTGTGGVS